MSIKIIELPRGKRVTWMGGLQRFFSTIVDLGCYLASALIVVIGGLTLYATGMRYLFGQPQLWSDQLSGMLLLTAAMLVLARCLREGIHVRVELVIFRLPVRLRALAEVLAAVAGLAFAVVLIWKGWDLAWTSYERGYNTSAPANYPLFPSQLMIPMGCLLLAVALLERAGLALGALFSGRSPAVTIDAEAALAAVD